MMQNAADTNAPMNPMIAICTAFVSAVSSVSTISWMCAPSSSVMKVETVRSFASSRASASLYGLKCTCTRSRSAEVSSANVICAAGSVMYAATPFNNTFSANSTCMRLSDSRPWCVTIQSRTCKANTLKPPHVLHKPLIQ